MGKDKSIQLNSKYIQKYISWFFVLLGLCCLLPFLLLTKYAYPQADDYYFAIRDSQTDFWTTQIDTYHNWSGRFFGTAILRLNPLINNSIDTYKFYSLGIIIALAFSLIFLINNTVGRKLSNTSSLGLALFILALYLAHLPSTSEGLFWLTGFLTYTLPNVLFLWLIYFCYKLSTATSPFLKIAYTTLATIIGSFVVGANEMALVYVMATLSLIALANWLAHTPNRHYFLAIFIVCFVVSLVVVMAPGNYSRMAAHDQAKQPLWSVLYAGVLSTVTLLHLGGMLLLASLVHILAFGEKIKSAFQHSTLFTTPLPLLIVYLLGTVFLMNFLFVWATGERPTLRLQNVIYFFLLTSWLYTLQAAICQKPQWFIPANWPAVLKPTLVVLLLLSSINLDTNISTAYLDLLSGKAAQYNLELSLRNQRIEESACKNCEVEPVSAIPASIHFLDLQTSEAGESEWINKDYALFWAKESVILTRPSPPVEDNYSTLTKVGKKWKKALFN